LFIDLLLLFPGLKKCDRQLMSSRTCVFWYVPPRSALRLLAVAELLHCYLQCL